MKLTHLFEESESPAPEESWDTMGIKDPSKRPHMTYLLDLWHEMNKNLPKDRWRVTKSNYTNGAANMEAEILDRREGVFYSVVLGTK